MGGSRRDLRNYIAVQKKSPGGIFDIAPAMARRASAVDVGHKKPAVACGLFFSSTRGFQTCIAFATSAA
jgi:hypothetical protein